MNKLLPGIIRSVLLLLLLTAIPVGRVLAAGSLQLSPTAQSAAQNGTFTVTLSINTDNNSVTGSDTTLQYDPAGLEFVSAASGHFFTNMGPANDAGAGQLVIHGYVSNFSDAVSGTGTVATITFKVKSASGSSRISTLCSASGTDSNIISSSGTNILSCANVNYVSVTYGAAEVVPTPTPAPGGTNTIPTCSSLSSNISSGVGAPLSVTFNCAGVDPDGYINAANFDFGDGTADTIVKNVGSPGSISTTHTFTTIGSLGVSCKVQDNNAVWSPAADACRKIITISPKPATRTIYKTVSAQSGTAGTPTPTPTPQEVALVYETPTPELTPEPTVAAPKTPSTPPWLLIGAVALIAVGGVIYLLSRKSPPPPPPAAPPINP